VGGGGLPDTMSISIKSCSGGSIDIISMVSAILGRQTAKINGLDEVGATGRGRFCTNQT
jgi:hypothetical protein